MDCKSAIEFWFSLNEKTVGTDCQLTGDDKTGYKLSTTTKSVAISKCLIGTAEFMLITDSIMSSHDHPMIFGFYKKQNDNKILARYFWCSRSEGCWRAGTGFRPAEDRLGNKYYDVFGAFIKGQEHVFSGGYTFETQLHNILEKKLTDLYQEKESAHAVEKNLDFNVDITSKAIKEFLIRPKDTKNLPAINILKKYMDEVKIVQALDDSIHDKNINKSMTQAVGATTMQRGASQNKNILSNFKKTNSALWQLLITCLEKSPVNKKPYSYYSALLAQNIKVESYLLSKQGGTVLKNVVIEIAYTENSVNMGFKNKAGTMTYNVNAPVCWVKSVYLNGELSSFGNYQEYPWDLSFLPQKPMDYDFQISDYLKGRESSKPDKDYTSLALFNEKYSPLIQAFKILKGFNFIKTTPAYATVEQYLTGLNNKAFLDYFKTKIVQSCTNYLDYNRQNPSVTHGSTGRTRVTEFLDAVFDCQSYAAVNKVAYELFVNNTVKGKSYTSLIGTGKIATRASSYIVFFCDTLLETMVVDINDHFADASISKIHNFKLDMNNNYEKNIFPLIIKDKKLKGKEQAITRAALYIKSKGITGHISDSGTLKEVINAMAGNV